jgi:tryptophan-rich sensory protein
MTKLCPDCHAENSPCATSCSECGASLTSTSTEVSASWLKEERPPEVSGAQTISVEHGRWHDVARLLAFIWATFSTLFIVATASLTPYFDPTPIGASSFLGCIAICVLITWATVFVTWRWPSIGAVALLTVFSAWIVFTCRSGSLSYWSMVLLCPALLTLPPAGAIALHLADRQGGQSASGHPPPGMP